MLGSGSPAMNDRRYTLNRKALAVTRVMGKGPNHDKKWGYIYVSEKGVICTDSISLVKVDLPAQSNAPVAPQVFTKEMLAEIKMISSTADTVMPEGLEPKSTGQISVPNFSKAIPDPNTQVASMTVNAKALIDILKVACEVTDHSRFLVKLRICGSGKNQVLRIDAHRDAGAQEMVGVLMGTVYEGNSIPGNATGAVVPMVEYTEERKLVLPLVEGRRFRE